MVTNSIRYIPSKSLIIEDVTQKVLLNCHSEDRGSLKFVKNRLELSIFFDF